MTDQVRIRAFAFSGRELTLGRIAGIRIALDWSWFVVAGLLFLTLLSLLHEEFPGARVAKLLPWAAAGMLVFFASLLAHELSHSLVARMHGMRPESIVLFALGGVSKIRSEPTRPEVELRMAGVGPLTSAALGAALLAVAPLVPAPIASALLSWLGTVNLGLAVFNLLPGFPLDGGRIFRSIAWGITGDFHRATRWATGAGIMLGTGLILLGLTLGLWTGSLAGGIWMALIGWFLRSAAQSTRAQSDLVVLLENLPAGPAAEQPPRVWAQESAADVLERRALPSGCPLFVVEHEGIPAGLLTPMSLVSIPPADRGRTPAARAMIPLDRCASVTVEDSLLTALNRMAESPIPFVTVRRGDDFAGVIGAEQIARVARFHSLVTKSGGGRDRPARSALPPTAAAAPPPV